MSRPTPEQIRVAGEKAMRSIRLPLYDKSFGYALAAEVLQSGAYRQLSDRARAECDELLARGLQSTLADGADHD